MWKIENLFENEAITAKIELSDEAAEISLKDSSYSLGRVIYPIDMVRANYFAKITVPIEKTNVTTDVKIYEIYYDNEKELMRQYVDSSRPSLVPDGANRLDVVVLARGFGPDTVKIGKPTFEEIEPYKTRFARIISLDVAPKLATGQKRTCQLNLEWALAKIDEVCTKEKPDLVLLTEIFLTLGVDLERPGIDYVRYDGPEIKRLCDMAKKHHTYLSFSVHETDENGYYYNGSPLINRDGEIVATYRKTHPTMKELAAGIIPGDKVVTYDTDFGRIGFATCWDLFFPEFTTIAAKDGVEILLNPTLGYHFDQNSMRAQDTGCYIVSAGSRGETCVIMSPFKCQGVISDGSERGYALADIDLNYRHAVPRLSAPSSAERRNVCKYETNYEILEKYK